MKSRTSLASLCFIALIGVTAAQDTSAPAKKVLASSNGVAKTIHVLKTGRGFDRLMAVGALKDAILKKRPFTKAEHDAIVAALFRSASTREEFDGLDISNPAVEALAFMEAVHAIRNLAQSKFGHDQWVAVHGMNTLIGLDLNNASAQSLVDVAKALAKSKDRDLANEAKGFLRSLGQH